MVGMISYTVPQHHDLKEDLDVIMAAARTAATNHTITPHELWRTADDLYELWFAHGSYGCDGGMVAAARIELCRLAGEQIHPVAA